MNPKQLDRRVKDLERRVQRLTPSTSPGVLTTTTPKGTFRRATATNTAATRTATTTPRWG